MTMWVDLGDMLYGGEFSSATAAERGIRDALARNGRPAPSGGSGSRDPFTSALRSAWSGCGLETVEGVVREWNDRTHEATSRRVSIEPRRQYDHRDDPVPNERPSGTDGRIGGPPDTDPLRDELFDPQLGLISNLFRDLNSSGIATVGAEFRYASTVVTSFGRGETFGAAERVAILEMIERHALHDVAGEVHRDPYAGPGYVDPRALLHFAETQAKDRVAYRDGDPIQWLRGVHYPSGEPAHVPLQAVELGHVAEPRYLYESSSGAAVGSSLSEARLFALLEMIERDAFLVFWIARPQLQRIDPGSLPRDLGNLVDSARTPQRSIDLFNLTMDITVPAVLCLIRDEDGPVRSYLSTASHLDPATAVRLAVDEAVVGHAIYATNPALAEEFPATSEVDDMFDHVHRGASRASREKYDYLRDSETVQFDEWARRYPVTAAGRTADDILRSLVHQVSDDTDVYFVDVTTDVSFSHGLFVAKAIVPEMLPMTFGHRHRRINLRRVRRAIARSGYAGTDLGEERLREHADDPHPFP